ncbi:hypothetical protein ABEW00_03980 [Rossellomorea vietnamensis]|uniref:hypothetical protein n=1 Tax=Rossellomorea vietnamensis TaxID=218284 RepID=UPI003D279CEF
MKDYLFKVCFGSYAQNFIKEFSVSTIHSLYVILNEEAQSELKRKVLDSCGISWTGETPQAQPRRLTASPAESEHLQRKGTVQSQLKSCISHFSLFKKVRKIEIK